jgi:plasmid stabilization system protein ParE
MRVTYSPRALAQLEDIFNYIAAEDPTTATAVVTRITTLVSLLSQHPYLGRPTDKVDVHVLSVPRYPYVVFYKVLPATDEVRILRVRHTARRPLKGNH